MVDEIYDRAYQAGREDLHAGFDRAIAAVIQALGALHRVQWSSPWISQARPGPRT